MEIGFVRDGGDRPGMPHGRRVSTAWTQAKKKRPEALFLVIAVWLIEPRRTST
jgi:hypothetical protein